MTFASQISLFFFLVMVYDRVGDGDKHSYETQVIRRNQAYFSSSNVSTDATVIVKD